MILSTDEKIAKYRLEIRPGEKNSKPLYKKATRSNLYVCSERFARSLDRPVYSPA